MWKYFYNIKESKLPWTHKELTYIIYVAYNIYNLL